MINIFYYIFTRKLVAIIEKQKKTNARKIKHKNIGTWCKEYTKFDGTSGVTGPKFTKFVAVVFFHRLC